MDSVAGADSGSQMRQKFVEAARRAELLALVNAVRDDDAGFVPFLEQLCRSYGAEVAVLVEDARGPGPAQVLASVGASAGDAAGILERDDARAALRVTQRATTVAGKDVFGLGNGTALAIPERSGNGRTVLLAVVRLYERPFDESDRSLLETVAPSVGQALERIWAFQDRDRREQQRAELVGAAKAMVRSRSVFEVLNSACTGIERALEGGVAIASLGDDVDGYEIVATASEYTDLIGFRQPPGTGLGGNAVRAKRSMMTHAYQEEGYAPAEGGPLARIRTAMSVPLRWDSKMRGFITCGFLTDRRITAEELTLLEGLTECAGLAAGNADRAERLREVAAIDGLTGCINRMEFNRVLSDELQRARPTGSPLTLVLLDIDGFRAINEAFGHPVGDTTLREIGTALQESVRDRDVVARFGGDEFALILPDTTERSARAIVGRVRAAVRSLEVPGGQLTACIGCAESSPEEQPATLVASAAGALRSAKQDAGVDGLRRAHRTDPSRSNGGASRDPAGRERIHEWRALAGDIGLAIAERFTAVDAATATVSELSEALPLTSCAVLRFDSAERLRAVSSWGGDSMPVAWLDPHGGAVAQALREKRPILEKAGETMPALDGEIPSRRRGAQLVVPLMIDRRVWGALACQADPGETLDGVDGELLNTVAQHLSAAIRAAGLYEQLSSSMIGTAEALAAALEAKDSYTADHARSIADIAVDVGRHLALSKSAIEDLRYGGIFHDVGKIAVPDALLNKPGPLTDDEFEIVKRHPEAGADILAPIPFLSGVRSIVRHAHEHWDGSGYPDGLRGEEIPLGARVILAVDAFHAMTSDRPYRAAMSDEEACEELRACSGTQFDPEVIDALLSALAERGIGTGTGTGAVSAVD